MPKAPVGGGRQVLYKMHGVVQEGWSHPGKSQNYQPIAFYRGCQCSGRKGLGCLRMSKVFPGKRFWRRFLGKAWESWNSGMFLKKEVSKIQTQKYQVKIEQNRPEKTKSPSRRWEAGWQHLIGIHSRGMFKTYWHIDLYWTGIKNDQICPVKGLEKDQKKTTRNQARKRLENLKREWKRKANMLSIQCLYICLRGMEHNIKSCCF